MPVDPTSLRAPERVAGPGLVLRLILPGDAAYLHGLRSDPALNGHLSPVQGSAEDQRRWIEAYKAREAAGEELYYIIERTDGQRCGTVRLYGIGGDHFTWGSWILDRAKPRKAALESAWLVYRIGFDLLDLKEARFDVRRGNDRTLAFHRRFGATETHADATDVFFTYPRSRFEADRTSHLAVLTEVPSP